LPENNSIYHATGRFIAFCDSDDMWMPEKLENQIQFMLNNNYYFTYGAYNVEDEDGKFKGTFMPPLRVNYSDLLKTCSIGCLTAVYDSEKLGKVYMPSIKKRQDYALWLRILKRIDYAYSYNGTSAVYRVKNESVSSNKFAAAKYQWRIYREIEKIGFMKSLYYMVHYGINGILKPN
jgi:teichuronic acid biosynthesis glycosyltransferase TuaG